MSHAAVEERANQLNSSSNSGLLVRVHNLLQHAKSIKLSSAKITCTAHDLQHNTNNIFQ